MSENRQTLNKIIGSLANIDVKLGNITQALEKKVFQVGQFGTIIFTIRFYYTGIKKNSLASYFLSKAYSFI